MIQTPNYRDIFTAEDTHNIGRVGVLYGGVSDERSVSLWSGAAIHKALCAAGVNATLIDVNDDFLSVLLASDIDFAFIALHGRGGEDGSIQAILDWQNIPYTGSGVLASATAMDKVRTKQLWKAAGLPVAPDLILEEGFNCEDVIETLGLPLAVKPALEGSSNGISKVSSPEQLLPAFMMAKQHDSVIMAERWIEGDEYTGAIIGDLAHPLIRIEIADGIYDFNTKYITGAQHYHCPCGLAPEVEEQLQNLILEAARVIGLKDWGRVDLMLDSNQQPWLIEINTIPGMTENSLVPKATNVTGMDFTATVLTILKTAWEVHNA